MCGTVYMNICMYACMYVCMRYMNISQRCVYSNYHVRRQFSVYVCMYVFPRNLRCMYAYVLYFMGTYINTLCMYEVRMLLFISVDIILHFIVPHCDVTIRYVYDSIQR